MRKKSTIAIIILLAVLAVAVTVLAVLNSKSALAKQQLLKDARFLIAADGEEYTVAMEDLEALEPREIVANYKKSGRDPEIRRYTGVPFAAVLRARGVQPEGMRTAVFSAADGYVSALPIADALDEENCFIVIDNGNEGPFRMILAKDRFSQRWCKLLIEVTLK